MTEYTAHVQVPDAVIGAVLHDAVLDHPLIVTCATLRSGSGTWLSIGINAGTDNGATMLATNIRYYVSRKSDAVVPAGYDADSIRGFESAPMIITDGRTVVHSEGV